VGTNEEAVRQATTLDWNNKGLNDDDGKAIACLISSGSLGSLQELWLHTNPASDTAKNTMKAVASNRNIYLHLD
jgi:hypothetical protein